MYMVRRLIPVEQAIILYKKDFTVWEVGAKLGFTGAGIWRALKRNNISMRPPNPKGRPYAKKKKGEEYLGADGRWWVRDYKFKGEYKKRGRKKAERRAVVVMERKLGRLIPKGFHVHHRDRDITNDNINNLELISVSQHITNTHLGKKNLAKGHLGEQHPKAKLTTKLVKKIKKMYNSGKYSQQKLATKFNVHQTTISCVVTGRSWK